MSLMPDGQPSSSLGASSGASPQAATMSPLDTSEPPSRSALTSEPYRPDLHLIVSPLNLTNPTTWRLDAHPQRTPFNRHQIAKGAGMGAHGAFQTRPGV